MRHLVLAIVLAALLLPLSSAAEEYGTIDALVGAYGDQKCRACHEEIFNEWKGTPHADSVNLALGGMRNFFVYGVEDWWGRDVTKEDVLMCLDCHAPVMNFASEGLAAKVAEMVVSAKDAEDEKAREDAKLELAKLNVGCVSCHNLKATSIAIGRLGEPEEGAVYGVHGKESPAHKTIKSAEMRTALFCMQCHGTLTAPNGEIIQCNTISGSYQHGYVSRGGSRTCQDCHMKEKGRGHRIMGGRDLDLVREGIGFNVEVSRYQHLPGKGETRWAPSAIVAVELENRSGHRIPDG